MKNTERSNSTRISQISASHSLLWLCPLVLVACVHPSTPLARPDAGGLKSEIGNAKQVIRAARSSVENIGGKLASARTKAERIEGKAAVILENWQ